MPDERWLPVVGYEGCYEVSDQGRVRSLARKVRCKATARCKSGWQITIKPRLLTPNRSGSPNIRRRYGHLNVCLSNEDGSQTHRSIHTLVLTAFVGPRPQGMECRHLNGVAGDNRLINLTWGTAKENHADSVKHGTAHMFDGSERYAAKLQDADISAIRIAYASGVKGRALAEKYNISPGTISCIVLQKTWRHVPMTAADLDLFSRDRTQLEDHSTGSETSPKRDILGRFARKPFNNTNR